MAEEFQQLTRPARVEAALQGGEKFHPGFRTKVFAENAATIAWAKMPYQAGGLAFHADLAQPQVFAEMISLNPIGRKVFLAGDWFSHWPGWQVGALDGAPMPPTGSRRSRQIAGDSATESRHGPQERSAIFRWR